MHKTIIRIVSESTLGIGVVGHYEHRAAATYYLAMIAAQTTMQLETIATDHVYRIGSVKYVLEERICYGIEDVNRLRSQHEPGSRSPLQLTAADEHDLEIRLPHYTLYGSFYRWP